MTYIFESGLAHHIEGLIQQKRADGYAYNSEEKLLKRFDTFCVQNYPELTTVTYEMAAKWSEARPGEGDAYHNRCMSMVKVLTTKTLVASTKPSNRPTLPVRAKVRSRRLSSTRSKRPSL